MSSEARLIQPRSRTTPPARVSRMMMHVMVTAKHGASAYLLPAGAVNGPVRHGPVRHCSHHTAGTTLSAAPTLMRDRSLFLQRNRHHDRTGADPRRRELTVVERERPGNHNAVDRTGKAVDVRDGDDELSRIRTGIGPPGGTAKNRFRRNRAAGDRATDDAKRGGG